MSPLKTQIWMKVLIFAHAPPPFHGQSYMVQLILAGFGGDRRKSGPGAGTMPGDIDCYHVDVRVSRSLEDIGRMRLGKVARLLGCCFEAIWVRFRYGVENFYYIPAPGKRSAVYRDWLVMLLCRPFFKRLVLHWEAAGLGRWLDDPAQGQLRRITCGVLKHADVSIVLSEYNRYDAEKVDSRQIRIVHNGIPDPCPDFEKTVLPRRLARLEARRRLVQGQPQQQVQSEATGNDPHLFRLLFLGHCTREKGLFDALSGLAMVNERLAREKSPIRVHLTVAGEFADAKERSEFERISRGNAFLVHAGFVSGESKTRLLVESDCLCFPTFHYAESFGIVLIEAMAFGLSIVAARWRAVPELFPPGYPGLVEIQSPGQIAEALIGFVDTDSSRALREIFLQRFTVEKFLSGLAEAFHQVEGPARCG